MTIEQRRLQAAQPHRCGSVIRIAVSDRDRKPPRQRRNGDLGGRGSWSASFAGAMPRGVSVVAARMDRSLVVVALGAWLVGRIDLHNDPDCRNLFTCAGSAVAHCGRLCLRVLGFPLTYASIAFPACSPSSAVICCATKSNRSSTAVPSIGSSTGSSRRWLPSGGAYASEPDRAV